MKYCCKVCGWETNKEVDFCGKCGATKENIIDNNKCKNDKKGSCCCKK